MFSYVCIYAWTVHVLFILKFIAKYVHCYIEHRPNVYNYNFNNDIVPTRLINFKSQLYLSINNRILQSWKPAASVACAFCTYRCARQTSIASMCTYRCARQTYIASMCTYRCARQTSIAVMCTYRCARKTYVASMCTYRCARQTSIAIMCNYRCARQTYIANRCTYRCARHTSIAVMCT